ncbi:response regulator [Desulfocastanea catecholica]
MVPEILIVDDDQMMLDLLEIFLDRCGYNVTRATDGSQAAKVLDTQDFHLVITDLQMGRTSGFDVIEKVKKCNRKTKIIMMTGSCDAECEVEARRRGADSFFAKPFSMSALLACMCNFKELTGKYPSAGLLHQAQGVQQVSG